jgi:p-aminobenzoyl-glutamate transporter AbgT
MSTRPEHKLIFALVIIIVVLLVALAMYINYEYVAEERNATIMADRLWQTGSMKLNSTQLE